MARSPPVARKNHASKICTAWRLRKQASDASAGERTAAEISMATINSRKVDIENVPSDHSRCVRPKAHTTTRISMLEAAAVAAATAVAHTTMSASAAPWPCLSSSDSHAVDAASASALSAMARAWAVSHESAVPTEEPPPY